MVMMRLLGGWAFTLPWFLSDSTAHRINDDDWAVMVVGEEERGSVCVHKHIHLHTHGIRMRVLLLLLLSPLPALPWMPVCSTSASIIMNRQALPKRSHLAVTN